MKKKFNIQGHYLTISMVMAIIIIFLVWANNTELDLITKGNGRIITAGQNQIVQSPFKGILNSIEVEPGTRVRKGDLLATINPVDAKGVLADISAKKEALNIKMIRVNAELNKSDTSQLIDRLKSFSQALVVTEVDLFNSRVNRIKNVIEEIDARLEMAYENKKILISEEKGIKDLRGLINDELRVLLPLIQTGAVSKSERYRLEREKNNSETQLMIIKGKQDLNLSQIKQLKKQKVIAQEEYKKDLFEEKSRAITDLAEINAKLPSYEQKLSGTEIKSPAEGIINQFFYNTIGAVLKEGDVIAEIVPTENALTVKALIDAEDIASIEPGQMSKISLTAYDASRYGYINGKIINVSADSTMQEGSRSFKYEVEIELYLEEFISKNPGVTIIPGLVANVNIIRGRRSIIEYLWQPVAKIKDRAFRE